MIDHINSTVWATLRPSPIHGIGVFAIRDIPKGTQITSIETAIFQVLREDFSKILPEIRSIILDRTLFAKDFPLFFKSPNRNQDLRAYMNHSNTPNSDGEKALIDIRKDEEITEDYRSFYPLDELSRAHFTWLT